MKITVIGTGKLGLATATSLARIGHDVFCVDRDEYRVEQLSRGLLPFAEPELNAWLTGAVECRKLQFTSLLREAVASADTIYLAVDTPTNPDGVTDLRELWIVTDMLMYHLRTETRLVIKSVVPCNTNQQVADRINRMTWRDFDVISHPCDSQPESMVDEILGPEKIELGCRKRENADHLECLDGSFQSRFVGATSESTEVITRQAATLRAG